MPRPWTNRFAHWLRTRSFTSQVVFFSGGILVFLVLHAFLEYRGSVATDHVTQKQADVHSLDRRLTNLVRAVQAVRSLQLQMSGNPANDKLAEVNATLSKFKKKSIVFSHDLILAKLHEVSSSFDSFLLVFDQYKNSTKEILSVQRKLGFRGYSGLIDQMRKNEEAIVMAFNALKQNDLIVEFNAIQFSEREFVWSLNMKYRGDITQKMATLRIKVKGLGATTSTQATIEENLTSYENAVEQFSRHLLELELRTAAATLSYTRSQVPLRKAEKAIDRKLMALGKQLREQQQQSAKLQTLTFIASGAFVLLLLMILLRGTLQLNYRLKHLAKRMRTVSSNEEGTDIILSKDSPDDLSALTSNFETMSDRIARQIATVESARDQADRANEAKSRFIATVSHEVRTPMNGLLTTLQLMEHTKLDTEQREYVEIMRLSGDRMLELISDLLDFSKIEADRIELKSEPFPLHTCANDAVTLFQASAHEKGITLSLLVNEEVPQFVVGDATHLRQVLLNLISNAIKFTDTGHIEVLIEQQNRSPSDTVTIAFSVRDTGIGIALTEQGSLFDPFSQVDGTATRRHAGTGLGLAICDRIISLAGGTLKVKSEVSVGTTFSFELEFSIAKQSVAPSIPKRRPVLPPKLASEIPLQIIVAEDDPTTRRTMARLFKRLGYKPLIVKDGQEAADAVAAGSIDLVFMDMQMPVLDGLRATELIRSNANEHDDDSPIIIGLSGNASELDQQRCLDAGMNDFLAKPFELEDFVAMLRRWGSANHSDRKSSPTDRE